MQMINEWGHVIGCGVDEFDRPVKRSKQEYRYSYDGFVQERVHPNEKANGTIYTDRLSRDMDHKKYRNLQEKHFGKSGDWWGSYSAKLIEGFLREALKLPKLEVVFVMEYCNMSSGYPLWRIDYNDGEN